MPVPELETEPTGTVVEFEQLDALRERAALQRLVQREAPGLCLVSRAFPSFLRSLLTDIYLRHACSCPEVENGNEIEDGNAWTGGCGRHPRPTRREAPTGPIHPAPDLTRADRAQEWGAMPVWRREIVSTARGQTR
eukprot:SAG25_NODE_68_length_17436_cov_79.923055_9_plen_136_part_00